MLSYKPVLTPLTVRESIRHVQYAVRGKLVLEALKLDKQIKDAKSAGKPNPLPFDGIIYTNIGNPQQLNQPPLTFIRQVLACVEYPPLMEKEGLFPADVCERAKKYIQATDCIGATGAYSHSKGISVIREEVADFICKRDGEALGRPCSESIFLSDGASVSVKTVLNFLIKDLSSGIMTPIPQYPLYSATIAAFEGKLVGYYLDEANGWSLNVNELERSLNDAKSQNIEVRGLVVINPNNPTGTTLTRDNMIGVLKFCHDHSIALLADEVYQENVYTETPFLSFRKVLKELGGKIAKELELFSFHSVSKGFLGECGKRGGYMQLENIDDAIVTEFYKIVSVNLCPNTVGQLVTGMMVNPPCEGEPSYKLYEEEKANILGGMKTRAMKLSAALNHLEGYTCSRADGAMYLFPSVSIPPKAIAKAKELGETPDTFYCLELLRATGICVVPGSGFGQRENTFHFRTTFLPPNDKMDNFIERIVVFHKAFMDQYRG